MLRLITEQLASLPVERSLPVDDEMGEAAILLALVNDPGDPKIILTKWEEDDTDLLMTALRETEEEIGLHPSSVNVIASLPANFTRHSMRVSPYVGIVPPGLLLTANPSELDAVFDVPLRYLLDPSNLKVDHFTGPDYSLRMPCYIYQGYRIWGFSLVVLTDFLNLTLNAGIELHYPDRANSRPDIEG